MHKEDYLEQMDQIGAFFPGHLIDMGRVVTRLLDGSALKESLRKEFGMTVDLFDEASRVCVFIAYFIKSLLLTHFFFGMTGRRYFHGKYACKTINENITSHPRMYNRPS